LGWDAACVSRAAAAGRKRRTSNALIIGYLQYPGFRVTNKEIEFLPETVVSG
jgi:hypothetical protein